MKLALFTVHLIISIGLISVILLQSGQGGLGSAFGGGELFRTKRGAERIVFIATIVASVVFLLTSITTLLVG